MLRLKKGSWLSALFDYYKKVVKLKWTVPVTGINFKKEIVSLKYSKIVSLDSYEGFFKSIL